MLATCGCLADYKTPCMHAPAVTVGWINSPAAARRSAVWAAGRGMSVAAVPRQN